MAIPGFTSVNNQEIGPDAVTQSLTITGVNLTGCTAVLVDHVGTVFTPTTVTVASSTQLTMTFSGADRIPANAVTPFDVIITEPSGVRGRADNAIYLNDSPVFSTAAGNVGSVFEDKTMSSAIALQVSDPTNETLTYSVSAGALPSGLTLNSSNGEISGTPNVNDTYSASGVTHNFTVSVTDGTNTVSRAFNILREWPFGQSAAAAVAPSDINSLGTNGVSSGIKYIELPNVGATPTYIDTTTNGGGWILLYANDKTYDTSTATTRTGPFNYASGDTFFSGTRGSNTTWSFGGNSMNSGNAEKIMANLPYTDIMIAGNSFTGLDNSGYNFSNYFNYDAHEAYQYWAITARSSNTSQTHAQKLANSTSWTILSNTNHNLVYNFSWSTNYSSGSFKLGFANYAGPSYGDYSQAWLSGGTANRVALSWNGWRNVYPGMSTGLHNSPTSHSDAFGYASHRTMISHWNDSVWIKV